jgi:hypothetical protein
MRGTIESKPTRRVSTNVDPSWEPVTELSLV